MYNRNLLYNIKIYTCYTAENAIHKHLLKHLRVRIMEWNMCKKIMNFRRAVFLHSISF